MIARLTYFGVDPKDVEDMKKIYHEEIVPVLKVQKGLLGVWLLQPADPKDDYVSLTEWISRADAEFYESSGVYKELVNKIKKEFNGTAVLKTYTAIDSNIMATI